MRLDTPRVRAPRLVRAGLAVLLGAFMLVGVIQAPASAHASLLSSTPAEGAVVATAPAQVEFTFDERIVLSDDGVHVLDATGQELSSTAKSVDNKVLVDLPKVMNDGSYVVTWHVISADGHPVAGALTFSVGTPSAQVAAPKVEDANRLTFTDVAVLQAVHYLGIFLLAGLVLLLVWLLPKDSPQSARRRALKVAMIGAGAAWLTGLVMVGERPRNAEGLGFGAVFRGDTWFSALTVADWQALGCLSLGLALVGWSRCRPERAVVALAGAALALASPALVGHTRAVAPIWLVVTADLAHVLAGAIWFGSLFGLMLVWRDLGSQRAVLALVKFSTVAAVVLLLVAASGIVLAWRILHTFDAFWDTSFGHVLIIKLVVVAMVVGMAAYNRFVLLPVARTGNEAAGDFVRRVVRAEAAGLVVVLAITGFLVQQSPVADSNPAYGGLDDKTSTAIDGNVRAYVVADSGRVGRNTLTIQIQDTAGNPIEPFAEPTVAPSLGTVQLGNQQLVSIDSGTYQTSVVFPRAGTWTVRVSFRLSAFNGPVVDVKVPIR